MAKSVEEMTEIVERKLGFRVRGHQVEFLYFYGDGEQSLSRVRAVRPASEQELALWARITELMTELHGNQVNLENLSQAIK